uniref:TATA-box binding protein associated factor 6 like n=1 Tax=Strix occidentalis caurina TaxID=311401 RepID=A0A8D0FBK8_STROC
MLSGLRTLGGTGGRSGDPGGTGLSLGDWGHWSVSPWEHVPSSPPQAVCGYGSQDALPFRAIKEGDLYFQEDREVNLVELALATNIPKGCAETTVRVHVSYLDGKGNLEPQGAVPSAVSTLTDDLLKYYQHVTRAVLGDDPQLMKVALQDLQTNSKIAALLPYFVYVVSGVKSVSHDLEQLNRLLHIARSLIQNPFLCLGSYVRSLIGSVMYCALEPLAASINPLNDHWTLRDYAAMLLSRIFWTHGDLLSGLYHQILLSLQKVLADPVRPLCSHYGAVVGLHALGWKAVERVLYPHLPTYWANLQAVLDDYSVSNAQVKADGHKVYGAILVSPVWASDGGDDSPPGHTWRVVSSFGHLNTREILRCWSEGRGGQRGWGRAWRINPVRV